MLTQKINQNVMRFICLLGLTLPFQMAFADLIAIPSDPKKMQTLLKKLEAKGDARNLKESRQLLLLRMSLFRELGNSKEVNEKTIQIGKALSKKYPDNAHLKSIIAASTCLRANFEKTTGKQMLNVRKCSIALDKLVKKNPDDLNVLIVRVNTYKELPSLFKKKRFVVADWKKIHELTLGKIPPLAAQSAYELGLIAEKDDADEAKRYYQLAVEQDAGFWSKKAQEKF